LVNLNVKAILFLALGIIAAVFSFGWFLEAWRTRNEPGIEARIGSVRLPTFLETGIGFATNFFDALGIGSYAPTTSLFKLGKIVPDECIPGTLNVGHAAPVIAEAFIFIAFVEVEVKTLILMIIASVVGAWLGAGIVATWSRRNIQLGMGIALLVAAVLSVMANLGLFPGGGNTLSLSGFRLVVGIIGNVILGALMTLGIGLYAPCMILVGLLGMNTKVAFPIMMGSCAFLMPIASLRFIRKQSYSFGPGLGLALGGLPAVLFAAFIVKSLPLVAVRWMVVLVVIYTAIRMLLSVTKEGGQGDGFVSPT
jgi:uncharacterized membrane protein YfcA